MKKILMLLIALVFSAGIFAQQQGVVVPDNKLYSRFQTEDIDNMLNLSPQEIEYWNWFVNNGYVIKRTEPSMAQKYPPLRFFDKDTKTAGEEEVAYDEGSFNIMAYDFEVSFDKSKTYRIGNTGYVVGIYSSQKLVSNYNKYLGR
ncbi:MAG: hypothetical protein J5709_00160 [Bacteroidales bacterium]|nr:hypothetical protein [Bacteroidales bacterium]